MAVDGSYGWAYFVTGRSIPSRQRRLRREPDGLVIEAIDPGAPMDALRHYTCARQADQKIVVGNGDHVDGIARALLAGAPFSDILDGIEPEPDPPIFTPRLALCLGASATLLIARRSGESVSRVIVDVLQVPHTSTVVTTYDGNLEDPTGSAPIRSAYDSREFEEVIRGIWDSFDPRLRVLLVAGVGSDIKGSRSLP